MTRIGDIYGGEDNDSYHCKESEVTHKNQKSWSGPQNQSSGLKLNSVECRTGGGNTQEGSITPSILET